MAAAPLAGRLGMWPRRAGAAEAGWRRFALTTRVTLLDSPGPAQLWLPLVQSAGDYQTASAPLWRTSGQAGLLRDPRYGAGLLRVRWTSGGAAQWTELVQEVATRDRGASGPLALSAAELSAAELSPAELSPADWALWTAPSPSIPTDGLVRETAQRITAGRKRPCDRLRALYDWVVDTTWRNPDTPGCGTGDFATMLRTGNFGGKCADINGLMVGLARAAGLPARDVYGIRVAPSHLAACLGRSGDVSRAQHCRAEVFLDGEGWFPVDPADVRKVILEARLPADSGMVRRLREHLFGQWEMNWVGFNDATDIVLPGAGGQTPDFAFLMYPCALTAEGQPDCLEPGRFRYQITSRALTAAEAG